MTKDSFRQNFLTRVFETREDAADPSVPRIELTGNRSLTVTGAKGIISYGEGEIRLATGITPLTVTGRDLIIESYNAEAIVIVGFIERMEFAL